jgi:hypothetical protein
LIVSRHLYIIPFHIVSSTSYNMLNQQKTRGITLPHGRISTFTSKTLYSSVVARETSLELKSTS